LIYFLNILPFLCYQFLHNNIITNKINDIDVKYISILLNIKNNNHIFKVFKIFIVECVFLFELVKTIEKYIIHIIIQFLAYIIQYNFTNLI
jgi:hypothetical protein